MLAHSSSSGVPRVEVRDVLHPASTSRSQYDPAVATPSNVTLGSGLRLSYGDQRRGSEPVVVLLPGPTDSWHSYRPVLDLLPPDVGVIAVSQRGHGDSDKPDTGYRVEDFAADVVQLLDGLGVERAVLVGHSGSCFVARRAALDHPERVAGLILEASPTTLREDARLVGFVESVVSGLEDPIDADFVRTFAIDTSSADVTPDLLDELVGELLKVPARVWHEMFAALLQYDDMAELGRLDAPALLLWGDADVLVLRDMQDQLATCIPDADLLVDAGVGHVPRWDDPARFSHDVATFARSLRP